MTDEIGQSPNTGSFFDTSGTSGCLALDEEGIIVEANLTAATMLGTEASRLIGTPFSSLIAPSDKRLFLASLVRVFEKREPQTCAIRLTAKHAANCRAWLENIAAAGSRLKCSCIISIASPADRPPATARLSNDSPLWENVFDVIPTPVFCKDSEGLFIGCNKAYTEFLGLPAEEIIGKSVHEVFEKDLADKYAEMDQALFRNPGSQEYEFLVRDRFNNLRDVMFRKATIPANGNGSRGLVGIILDISDRKLLEKDLRQAQKMEALGTLASGIAHDFNNILAPIIGYTEMALIDMPEPDVLRTNLRHVLTAANRAKHLVKQILAFTTLSEQTPKPVQVSSILTEAVSFLEASLPSTVEIRKIIAPDAKTATVWADSTQIFQVLINLCTNAVHAMPEKSGTMELSLSRMDSKPEPAPGKPAMKCGNWLRLSVTDTGEGMSESTVRRIFDPFFTTKPPGQGTGLGLTVAHRIVENFGGRISVWSAPKEGTTFHVDLPRYEGAGRTDADVALPLHKGRGRILIVDDEESMVEIQRCMLEQLGYEVVARLRSIDALETFRSHPGMFQLVIADHTMPQLTGAKLAEEILNIRADIPVILCTGFSEQIDETIIGEKKVKALLLKPFSILELANAVYRVLNET